MEKNYFLVLGKEEVSLIEEKSGSFLSMLMNSKKYYLIDDIVLIQLQREVSTQPISIWV